MKKPFVKLGLILATFGLLAGCNGGSSVVTPTESEDLSSEVVEKLTDEEFEIATTYIAKKVPLVLNRGETVPTNIERAETDAPIYELKFGDNLELITGGELKYEDDENGIYLYPEYTVSFSFLELEGYAEFEFTYDDGGKYIAIPDYPRYEPEYDGGGNEITENIPDAKAGRLYITITIQERSKTFNLDVILHPQAVIHEFSLADVRDAEIGRVVKVRGYFGEHFADWNNGVILDGEEALGLFKLQENFEFMEFGKLYEVVGQFTVYNGLSQLQWIKSAKELNPADYPEIEKPRTIVVDADTLADQIDIGTDLSGPLMNRVGANVMLNFPLRFKELLNRDGLHVEPKDLELGKHADAVLTFKDSDGEEIEIKLSLNYHMGETAQAAFRDFFVANADKDFYYTGPLGAYNAITLAPFVFEGTLSTTAPAV